jgi:hypothetical protein
MERQKQDTKIQSSFFFNFNTKSSISPYVSKDGIVSEFCTAGLDGRVLFWKVSDLEKAVSGFKC